MAMQANLVEAPGIHCKSVPYKLPGLAHYILV